MFSSTAIKILGLKEEGGKVSIVKDTNSGRYLVGNGAGLHSAYKTNKHGQLQPDLLLPEKLRIAYKLNYDKLYRLRLNVISVRFNGVDYFELLAK